MNLLKLVPREAGVAAVPTQQTPITLGLGIGSPKTGGKSIKSLESIKESRKALAKIIDEFKTAKKFDYEAMEGLDLQVAKYLGAVNSFNNSVYYPYQKVLSLVLKLDPTFKMTDYEVRKEIAGSSVNLIIRYESKLFPQKFIVPLAPMVGKSHSAVGDAVLDTRIIDDAWGRAIAKTIAFNTGLGMVCWDEPDYVSHAITGNPESVYKPDDWYTPQQDLLTTGATGQMSIVSNVSNMPLPIQTPQIQIPNPIPVSVPTPAINVPTTPISVPIPTINVPIQQTPTPIQQTPAPVAPVPAQNAFVKLPPSMNVNQTDIPVNEIEVAIPKVEKLIITNPPVEVPKSVPTPAATAPITFAQTISSTTTPDSDYKNKIFTNKEFRAAAGLYAMEKWGALSPIELTPEQEAEVISNWTANGGL